MYNYILETDSDLSSGSTLQSVHPSPQSTPQRSRSNSLDMNTIFEAATPRVSFGGSSDIVYIERIYYPRNFFSEPVRVRPRPEYAYGGDISSSDISDSDDDIIPRNNPIPQPFYTPRVRDTRFNLGNGVIVRPERTDEFHENYIPPRFDFERVRDRQVMRRNLNLLPRDSLEIFPRLR